MANIPVTVFTINITVRESDLAETMEANNLEPIIQTVGMSDETWKNLMRTALYNYLKQRELQLTEPSIQHALANKTTEIMTQLKEKAEQAIDVTFTTSEIIVP